MTKYYVLTNLGTYDESIYPFDDLTEALACYAERSGYGLKPVLVQKIEVKLSVEGASSSNQELIYEQST